MEKKELNRKLHVGFWRKHLAVLLLFCLSFMFSFLLNVSFLQELPEQYAPQESNRLTLLYFVVCALDLLDSLPVDEEVFFFFLGSFLRFFFHQLFVLILIAKKDH